MTRVLSSELIHHIQQPVEIRGWLNNIRPFGKLNFLILRDRAGFAQIVIEDKEGYKKISNLQPGSVLKITGTAVESSFAE